MNRYRSILVISMVLNFFLIAFLYLSLLREPDKDYTLCEQRIRIKLDECYSGCLRFYKPTSTTEALKCEYRCQDAYKESETNLDQITAGFK